MMDGLPPNPDDVLTAAGDCRVSMAPGALTAAIARAGLLGSTALTHPTQTMAARPFLLLRPDECAAAPPPDYIIKGLIAAGDLVLLTGQPGAGKSVIAPYLAYAVAQDRMVFGRRVRGGAVVYIAAEDAGGMKRRVTALRARLGEAADFRLLPEAPDLFDASDADLHRLIATVRDLRPRLVVLDTLARLAPASGRTRRRTWGA